MSDGLEWATFGAAVVAAGFPIGAYVRDHRHRVVIVREGDIGMSMGGGYVLPVTVVNEGPAVSGVYVVALVGDDREVGRTVDAHRFRLGVGAEHAITLHLQVAAVEAAGGLDAVRRRARLLVRDRRDRTLGASWPSASAGLDPSP
jgi:hypothetical protein